MAEQALTAVPAADGRAVAPPASPAARPLLPVAADGVELAARFFRALGEPARLRLLAAPCWYICSSAAGRGRWPLGGQGNAPVTGPVRMSS